MLFGREARPVAEGPGSGPWILPEESGAGLVAAEQVDIRAAGIRHDTPVGMCSLLPALILRGPLQQPRGHHG